MRLSVTGKCRKSLDIPGEKDYIEYVNDDDLS